MTLDDYLEELDGQNEEETLDFCRKTVLHGLPVVFNGDENAYYNFRKRIGEHFDVHYHQVHITGSAKLGFSPIKQTQFSLDSDIDVAIVSESLFDRIMDSIYIFQMGLRRSQYAVSQSEMMLYQKFLEYTALGWIRPDKLPYKFQVREIKLDWFDFFSSISHGKSEVGNYKVSAGAFKSYNHLEQYMCSGLEELKSRNKVKKNHASSD